MISFSVQVVDPVRSNDSVVWLVNAVAYAPTSGPSGGGAGIYRFQDVPDTGQFAAERMGEVSTARRSVIFTAVDAVRYVWDVTATDVFVQSPVGETRPGILPVLAGGATALLIGGIIVRGRR